MEFNKDNAKLVKTNFKWYKKGEHKTLSGPTIFQNWNITVDGKIVNEFIILSGTDLYFKGIEKLNYKYKDK